MSFQLSHWIPKENLYRRVHETLDLSFLYKGQILHTAGTACIYPILVISYKAN